MIKTDMSVFITGSHERRMKSRGQKGEHTRQRILAAATSVFSEYGYEKAGDFAAAMDRVLRSDAFRDWLTRRLQRLRPPSAKKPDRG